MIDIHSHILPGVDDGSPDDDATSAMLSIARQDGIVELTATPHADLSYRFDPAHCRAEIERWAAASPDGPRLHLGCEVHLTPENLEAAVRTPRDYALGGRDCLLLELPNLALASAIEPGIQFLLEGGLRPIIVHPERNPLFLKEPFFAERLVDSGCFLQLTAQSITGSFGPDPQRLALSLLKNGLAHFVASDAHGVDHRRPLLSTAFAEIERRFSNELANLLFVDNPRAALQGGRIDRARPPARSWVASFFRAQNAGRPERAGSA